MRADDDRRPVESDPVAEILAWAGALPPVPSDRAARVRAAVEARWRAAVRRRRRRGTLLAGAAAIMAFLGIGLATGVLRVSRGSPELVVEASRGTVRVDGRSLSTGRDGRAALRLDGISLRLDRATRVRIEGDRTVFLDAGAVYVDSGAEEVPGLSIRTSLGTARDVGTRFEVRRTGSSLRVRVRDGRVRLERDGRAVEAAAGDELTATSAGAVRRTKTLVHGPEWAWILAVAPPLEIEGLSVAGFVAWVGGETGWRVSWASAEVEREAGRTMLHGSIGDLAPDRALQPVLATTGFRAEVENGVLEVSR